MLLTLHGTKLKDSLAIKLRSVLNWISRAALSELKVVRQNINLQIF